jgi:hypothetical protein
VQLRDFRWAFSQDGIIEVFLFSPRAERVQKRRINGGLLFARDLAARARGNHKYEPVGDQAPALFGVLRAFDGMAGDLPSGLASNLDHYVHGR